MNYAANLDGNLAALGAYEREQESAHYRFERAEEQARVEFETDLKSFDDAITDLGDTLSYWNLTDAEVARRAPHGGIYTTRLERKRLIARRALTALQNLIVRPLKSLTPDELAIRELIETEAASWLEGRAEDLQSEAVEARQCAAEAAADARRDEEALADYLNGRGE